MIIHKLVENGEITESEEIVDVYFLFIAGQDTTASTLDIGIILTGKYMDVQEKYRVLSVMNDRFDLKMAHNCPLFRVYIHEILRISSVAYVGVNHATKKNKWIIYEDKQYMIPKNIPILTNTEYIHNYNKNDENWKFIDGDKIFLENWLTDDMRFVVNESFIGFGVGRRDCVGRH